MIVGREAPHVKFDIRLGKVLYTTILLDLYFYGYIFVDKD